MIALTKVALSETDRKLLRYTNADDESDWLNVQSQPESTLHFTSESDNDTDYKQGYVTNQNGVAGDILTFLHEFYKQFPEKRMADLYLTSESYGGI